MASSQSRLQTGAFAAYSCRTKRTPLKLAATLQEDRITVFFDADR
ncbi:hypothetical protein ABIB90_007185 [Bradyrhizobium sp. JR4.1]